MDAVNSVDRDAAADRDRQRAGESWGQARSLGTLILKSSRDCIVVLDLDGNTLMVSPGGVESMEISDVEAILGLSWLRVWKGKDHAAAVQAVAEARMGRPGQFQGFCPTHKGTPRWWDVAVYPLPGIDGNPDRLVAVGRDITRQILAQEQLALSEESQRLAVEAADIGTWDLDLRTNILTWSDRTKAMFGISPDVPCSMDDFYAGLHKSDVEATSVAFASALDPVQRATYDVEYRTVGKQDGVIRWVAAKGKGIFDHDGQCVRAIGTAIDITARKNAATRQSFLLELGDQLLALTDPQHIMAHAVRKLGAHLGVSRVGYGMIQPDDATVVLSEGYVDGVAPLIGTFALSDFGPDDIARQRLGMTVFIEDVASTALENDWLAINTRSMVSVPLIRDGRLKASLYVNHVEPRPWPDADIALIENVARRTWDAVERARAEADLRDANSTLEKRIAEALADREKIEATLRQSQKMEAVGQLTGGIAHDFNNLLTGILGSLELMQTRIVQGRIKELDRYLSVAQGAAKRAAALTHRLLAFSRQQTLDPKSADLNSLVGGMEDLIRGTVGPGIAVKVQPGRDVWKTLVDPGQLENSLLNLCINARDAMPDAGTLTITTSNSLIDARFADELDLQPGEYISLCVADTGSGMTPEVMARAFDPFFTTKPIGQGTGLGLSMIYGFARQSGGQVNIKSVVGSGTVVCLYLPRYLGETVEQDFPDSNPAAVQAGRSETILIVDDEPTVRMLVTDALADLGYNTIGAADGPAAMRILQSDSPIDFLVTDVGLTGGLNGRQVADIARATRPHLKVLFITGYAETAVLSRGQLAPGMHILTKPFVIDTLTSKINDLIHAR